MTDTPQLFSRTAEDALLGAILIDPQQFHTLTVKPDDFQIERNRTVWEAFIDTIKAGREIDIITVYDEIVSKGRDIGGPSYLSALITGVPASYNAEHYADIVTDYARRRNDVRIANLIAQGAYGEGVDRAKVIDMLTHNTSVDQGAVSIGSLLNGFYTGIEERAKHPADIWGMSTGLKSLDRATGGLHSQQTTMMAGSPGVGKTTLLLQIILNATRHGHVASIYELEMDADRLIGRLVSMITGVPIRDMKTGRMENHWENFNKGIEIIESLPMYICDNPVMNTSQIRADVARIKATHGVELVGLDYLNLLTDKDSGEKNDDTTAKAVRFRQICREFKVSGISVQSITKEGMKSVIPSLADMSGPAEVGFTADNVFFLVGDQGDETKFNLLPAKMRDSDSGRKPIELIKPKGKIVFGEVEKRMY